MSENEPISPDHEIPEAPTPNPQPAMMQAAETPPLNTAPSQSAKPEGEAPMIDVHPPHEGIHSWKTYLLHMSTIVLGLLIAIGLEQSVEAVHRSNERSDLRESLKRETEKAIADAPQTEQTENDPLRWISARSDLVQTALTTHQPLPAQLPRKPHVSSSNLPIDPAWNAAKSSGLLHLLTQEEVEVYSEADIYFTGLEDNQKPGRDASYKRGEFEFRHRDPQKPGMIDLSHAAPEELNTYILLLEEEYSAWDQVRIGCEYLRGIETAINSGERDLGSIQKGLAPVLLGGASRLKAKRYEVTASYSPYTSTAVPPKTRALSPSLNPAKYPRSTSHHCAYPLATRHTGQSDPAISLIGPNASTATSR